MKRYRVKAVGLGLALWAGQVNAGNDPPPAALPAPAQLPPDVRAGDWTTSSPGDGTIWLAPRKPATARLAPPAVAVVPAHTLPVTPPAPVVVPVAAPPVAPVVVPSVAPIAAPPAAPAVVTPAVKMNEPEPSEPAPVGPRAGVNIDVGALPEIPALPDPTAAPPAPTTPRVRPYAEAPAWQPVPRTLPETVGTDAPPGVALPPIPSAPATADALPSAMPARQPKTVPTRPVISDPLPAPRLIPPMPAPSGSTPPPIPPAVNGTRPPAATWGAGHVEPELPTAPPELMVPAGVVVPGKHGTFGSPPVRISRDYPPLRELIGHDGFFDGLTADDGSGGAPAADRFYYRHELLLWWVRPQQIPVLATTSVNGGFGFLGDPGTRTLLGPGSFGDSLRVGMRQRAGLWLGECGTWGVDGSFFFLGRQTTSAAFDSGTFPTITRPIFAPNFNAEFGETVALPGFSSGVFTTDASSTLWGFDANVRRGLCNTCSFRSELFAGYRFLGMNESLRMTEFITALPGNPNDPAGTRIVVQDRFETKNRFNGGQIGYAMERNWGRLSLDGRASVALGNTHQTLDIAGSQVRLRPGMTTPDTFTGGLLAVGPNLGRFERDKFSVVPEVTINAGVWLTPTIKAYVGYNFLYWSNVIRPGEQIDRVVDVTFVPNPPPGVGFSGQLRPQPLFQQTDLAIHGIQFGLMGRW